VGRRHDDLGGRNDKRPERAHRNAARDRLVLQAPKAWVDQSAGDGPQPPVGNQLLAAGQ